ncbi:MAG TPA: cation diffusion facilitator family transporter, partial [Bryobacteraceae bacterium]|nr:cation diffusion facilitator family transporter [Bryobacteraceae bacterium]
AASVGNLLLGVFLTRTGKKTKSLVIEAHGRHVLTDSWTSFGVVAGLALALVTGWKPFDPLVAIAVAVNILFSGGKLIRESVRGLMDYSDPEIKSNIESELDALCREYGIGYHHLRYRHTGSRLLIDVHLQFPFATPVGVAHRIATNVEQRLSAAMSDPAEVFTHLEAAEDHDEVHGPNQL